MITFGMIPGVDINVFLLIFLSLATGILSGFVGVGGGFFMTPALVILGFPANFAVGTSLTWVTGNSIVGAFRHGKLGNVDVKLGLIITLAAMGGIEIGVRILNWARDIGLTDEAVLSVSIALLLAAGFYILSECIRTMRLQYQKSTTKELLTKSTISSSSDTGHKRVLFRLHFAKSGVYISLWPLLAIGFLIGILAGFIGVGGGFLMVPSLIYLFGIPPFVAGGTNLFQVIFSAAYGSIRHIMSDNVIISASLIMIFTSIIGVQFGVSVTRLVQGVAARFILGISILIAAIGAILKLANTFLGETRGWLDTGSTAVTFSGLGMAVVLILFLFLVATRYNKGHSIPSWVKPLIKV